MGESLATSRSTTPGGGHDASLEASEAYSMGMKEIFFAKGAAPYAVLPAGR